MSSRKKTVFSILWMVVVIAMGLLTLYAAVSHAADEDLQKKVEALSKEVDTLKRQVAEGKPAAAPGKNISDWLTIGGDYRFRVDSLRGKVHDFYNFFDPSFQAFLLGGPAPSLTPGFDVKNDVLYTNRFGLNLKAKATKDVSVTARFLMYKVFGSQEDTAVSGLQTPGGVQPFFADRVGAFDGTVGHVPSDGKLVVDTAYATWTNILGQPVWFSVGRRPSTGGIPTHLRQNNEKPGNSGVPALLVDYAFDGMTLGYAPDIEAFPGAYAKLCYGRGFENGIMPAVRTFHDDVLPLVRMEWIDEGTYARSVSAFLAADRKGPSPVDCSSFEIMRRLGIRSAFTFDRCFRQYGFEILP